LGYAKPHTTTATVMSQMNSFDVGWRNSNGMETSYIVLQWLAQNTCSAQAVLYWMRETVWKSVYTFWAMLCVLFHFDILSESKDTDVGITLLTSFLMMMMMVMVMK
jgi:hypothetical protein